MKTNRKAFKSWLIAQINFEGYDIDLPEHDAQKLQKAMEICRLEVGWMEKTEGKQAMGIDWMTRDELNEAIPPAYTEFIGRQLLSYLVQK